MGLPPPPGVINDGSLMNERIKKAFFLSVGFMTTGLGIIGLFLPLMPTTCFLIVAVWAFSKSKPEFSQWILQHPQFGPAINHWLEHKAISRETKCKISLSIVIGFSLSLLIMTPSIMVSALMISGMLVLLSYINTRAELNTKEEPKMGLSIPLRN